MIEQRLGGFPVTRLVERAFSGRRGHGGSKRLVHRQMGRRELAELLWEMRGHERKRAAEIAKSHEDDDNRGPAALSLQIHDEIMAGAVWVVE